ncbi:hypothetical protein [Nocardioides sp. B-3]|uniref:hypothetical protein n=1 Tax=Nocardioides sp. B-3 TaxID=2895565 RepID=UPI00300E69CE
MSLSTRGCPRLQGHPHRRPHAGGAPRARLPRRRRARARARGEHHRVGGGHLRRALLRHLVHG